MQKRIYKTWLLASAFAAVSLTAGAKSLVLELSNGLRVFYKLGGEVNPQLVIADDGSFTLNTQEYSFADVACFRISATDYDGENGTVDAITVVQSDGNELSEASLYSLDGKRLGRIGDLERQQRGTYIIRSDVKSFKVTKR